MRLLSVALLALATGLHALPAMHSHHSHLHANMRAARLAGEPATGR